MAFWPQTSSFPVERDLRNNKRNFCLSDIQYCHVSLVSELVLKLSSVDKDTTFKKVKEVNIGK